PPGEVEVGDQRDARAVARRLQCRRDAGLRRSGPTGLLPGRDDHQPPLITVLLLDLGLAPVGQAQGADLERHPAGEDVAVDVIEHGAGHARRDAFHVEQGVPGLVERDRERELVVELHHTTSAAAIDVPETLGARAPPPRYPSGSMRRSARAGAAGTWPTDDLRWAKTCADDHGVRCAPAP